MSRTIPVDTLLGLIERAKQEFAMRALSQMPEGPYAAQYHHGVIVGMENVKHNLLALLKEADDAASKKEGGAGTAVFGKGGANAYG